MSAGNCRRPIPSATAAFAGAVLGIDVSITAMVALGSSSGINFMRPTVACTRNRAASQLKSDRVFREPRPHATLWSLRDAKNKVFEDRAAPGVGRDRARLGDWRFSAGVFRAHPGGNDREREMALCDILVCLDATAAGGGRLELALNLAQADKAHLTAV